MGSKYLGYRLAQRLSVALPSPVAFRWAQRLADVCWRCSAPDCAAVQANLSMALGMPLERRSPLVREVFRNFSRYVVEFFTMHQRERPDITVEGHDHLAEARRGRLGAILLTAHLGNWEFGAALIRRMGFPVSAVALPHPDPRMDRLFNRQRQRCGVTVIPLGHHAGRRSLQSLRSGALLGLLGDRDFTGNGVRVSLCGRQVALPRGPAILSLKSGAPLLPTFLLREGPWRFRLCVEPPIWPAIREEEDQQIRALTQAHATVLERYLKRAPDQWLLFQPLAADPSRGEGEGEGAACVADTAS